MSYVFNPLLLYTVALDAAEREEDGIHLRAGMQWCGGDTIYANTLCGEETESSKTTDDENSTTCFRCKELIKGGEDKGRHKAMPQIRMSVTGVGMKRIIIGAVCWVVISITLCLIGYNYDLSRGAIKDEHNKATSVSAVKVSDITSGIIRTKIHNPPHSKYNATNLGGGTVSRRVGDSYYILVDGKNSKSGQVSDSFFFYIPKDTWDKMKEGDKFSFNYSTNSYVYGDSVGE